MLRPRSFMTEDNRVAEAISASDVSEYVPGDVQLGDAHLSSRVTSDIAQMWGFYPAEIRAQIPRQPRSDSHRCEKCVHQSLVVRTNPWSFESQTAFSRCFGGS